MNKFFSVVIVSIIFFIVTPMAYASQPKIVTAKINITQVPKTTEKSAERQKTQPQSEIKKLTDVQVEAAAKEQTDAERADEQKMSEQYPAKTELSKKAKQIRIGMDKKQVLNLLGKPTWGEQMTGVPLVWIWQNGDCNPVFVTFDKSMQVNGYDEGRAQCLDTAYTSLPDNDSLCSNPGTHHLCV